MVAALWVAFALVVGGLAALLLVPVAMRAEGVAGEAEWGGFLELAWGPRLLVVRYGSPGQGRVHVFGIPVARFDRLSSAETEAEESESGRWRPSPGRLARTDPRVVWRMVKRGLEALHIRVRLGGQLGLGDPADAAPVLATARLVGDLAPTWLEIDFTDDLLEEKTELFGRMTARIIPAELATILVIWMIRADTRRVLRGT